MNPLFSAIHRLCGDSLQMKLTLKCRVRAIKEAAKEGESNPAELVIARANQFAFQVSDAEFQDVERGKKDIQAQNPRITARLSDTTKEGLRTNKPALEEGNQENNNSDDEDEEEEKSLDGNLNFEETTSLHSGEEEGGSFPEEPVVGL
jgi:hypothetical protein